MSRGAGLPASIYTRAQGGAMRYYARIGGHRVALVPPGQTRATTDPDVAAALFAELVTDYQKQQLRGIHGIAAPIGLATYASDHLVRKAQAGKVETQSLATNQLHLERACDYLGADRELATIEVEDVAGWIARLRDDGLSSSTIRKHLNSLGNLFVRAGAEKKVPLGYNPVRAYPDKPADGKQEAHWLEIDEAALLLESARTLKSSDRRDWCSVPFAYELAAAWLLTGGRPSEVTGLEVDDVSLKRETVTFRVNRFRRLKTLRSARVVRLWPQLAEILKAYFPRREAMGEGTLLFPSFRTGREALLVQPNRILARAAKRVGLSVTAKALRHTYCAARLQTLDAGAPVSPFTVGRELGHGGDALVKAVYGHLGNVRHRSDVVEYRIEQHAATLGDRISALAEH